MFTKITKMSTSAKKLFHTSASSLQSLTTNAIITYNSADAKSFNWKYEPIQVRSDLKPHELLIDVKYVGICHTDLALGTVADPRPKILGHEGVGIVKDIGSGVSLHKAGDRVALSYSYCDSCHSCQDGNVAYCEQFPIQNLADIDERATFFQGTDSTRVDGKFFGQSSFARLTVVNESSIVNLDKLERPVSDEQFKYLGPFGCGFQTGAGAVIIAGALKPKETVIIYGLGGVGFAGLLAAKITGASKIIVVDLLESKLELAKEAGATHVINASKSDRDSIKEQILKITEGKGVDLSVECVGGSSFVEAAIQNAAKKGRIVMLGVSVPTDVIKIPLFEFLLSGKQLIGCIEGNALPKEFVPKLIDWYLDGKFPIEKIIKFFKAENFEIALKEMKEGKVIKPILEF